MSTIKLAQNYLFRVKKALDKGYLVTYRDVTLELDERHVTAPLKVDEEVELFVYINQQKDMAVTMKKPYIDAYRAGLVEVVEDKPGLGVFVNVGLDKDMLVSRDDLPFLKKQWPQPGDKLFCYLKGGKNQIIARLVGRYKMGEFFQPETELDLGDKVEAYVFYVTEEGIVLFTAEGHELFVYFKHARKDYRMGELAEVAVTLKKDARLYNGSLIGQKELMLEDDAALVLEKIKASGGSIPFTDKSSPESIFKTFHMSKAAFKRALGTLYKNGLVTLGETNTVLKENH